MQQVFYATVIYTVPAWLIFHFNERKTYQYALVVFCLLCVVPNIRINPLSQGLSPYLQNGIYKTVSEINAKEPDAGWVVYGNFTFANFLKAAGINCLNGVQFVPPLKKLHVLDPTSEAESIYNRYAHIDFYTLIDDKDSVKFSLIQSDRYAIEMNPCSPRFQQLGIKYFFFSYRPEPVEVRCMTLVKDTLGVSVYRRNEK
jgi:hypothetical protein